MNDIIDKLNIKKIENKELFPYDLMLLADPSLDLIKEYTSRGEVYIAELHNVVVGVYVLIRTRPDTMELVNLAVNESFHGKGIGKALIKDAVETAKKADMKTLEVGTGNSSISQLALYQKCGFRIRSIDNDFFIKHYDEPIIENGIQCVDMVRLSMDLD